ncbi:MAG: hypothetical protein DDG59_11690 [Anaerolineae bacterium]|jgi:hypothetical protein|nr:MAG: hypothetical protein DDG59_11690 [Anaerolineae bacterium]
METVRHQILYKDSFAYCAHPHLVSLRKDWWVLVFNRAPRRAYVLHPPHDPHYYNLIMFSSDQGETWSEPQVVPDYDWYGVECAGLTVLNDSRLMLNQWRFHWLPLNQARHQPDSETFLFPEQWCPQMKTDPELGSLTGYPADLERQITWARANGGTFVHFSEDGGKTWQNTQKIETFPYSGGYGMRGGWQLPNGDILLPLSDVPQYQRVYLVRSRDNGSSWDKPTPVAEIGGRYFEEPTILCLPDGRLLMLLRENATHFLYQTASDDGGYTWSQPIQTPIWGYPAHLLLLPDQRLWCVFGYRRKPFGIRAVLSSDSGKSWEIASPILLRDDCPNGDLGYPSSVLRSDGSIYTVYYAQDSDGATCIMASLTLLTDG